MIPLKHTILSCLILQLIWIFFLKDYFVTKKNIKDWEKIIKDFFNIM